jgi:hypothetical protein
LYNTIINLVISILKDCEAIKTLDDIPQTLVSKHIMLEHYLIQYVPSGENKDELNNYLILLDKESIRLQIKVAIN